MGQEASIEAAVPSYRDNIPFHIPMLGSPESQGSADLKPEQRLGVAARHGQVEVVRELIRSHPDLDINAAGTTGWTPLMEAAIMGRAAVVCILLEQPNIDTNRSSVDGLTALMMASWWAYAAVVHLLLRHPHTDVNARNEDGLTALMKVASSGSSNNLLIEQERMRAKGHIAVMRLLLSHPQVDVNVKDKHGNTALIYAVKMGKAALTECLLSHPVVDLKVRNGRGKTAFDVCKDRKLFEMLQDAARMRKERLANVCRPVHASVIEALAEETRGLEEEDICVICLSAPRCCGFVHAGTVHGIVCQPCSKAFPVGSPCPLCRQCVEEVVGIPSPGPTLPSMDEQCMQV